MNIDQIDTFIEAANMRSFSKAADRLYKTQPGISRIIASLERELNTELFIRNPHRELELTKSGQIYFDVFMRFRNDLNNAAELCSVINEDSSTLRFGHAPYWVTSFFLPQVYHALTMSESPLNIAVESHEFGELSRRVFEKYLDMAITVDNDSIREYNLSSIELCHVRKAVVYSQNFANGSLHADPSHFAGQNFLLYNHPYFNKQKRELQLLESELGFVPSVKNVVNVESLNSQVMAGQGVVVLDDWSQQLFFPSLMHYPLESFHRVLLIYRNDSRFMPLIDKLQEESF